MLLVGLDLGCVFVLQTVHVDCIVQVVALEHVLLVDHQLEVLAHDDDEVSDDEHFDALHVALDEVGFVADAEAHQGFLALLGPLRRGEAALVGVGRALGHARVVSEDVVLHLLVLLGLFVVERGVVEQRQVLLLETDLVAAGLVVDGRDDVGACDGVHEHVLEHLVDLALEYVALGLLLVAVLVVQVAVVGQFLDRLRLEGVRALGDQQTLVRQHQ